MLFRSDFCAQLRVFQQRDLGLAVLDRAVHHKSEGLVERHFDDIKELARVEVLRCAVQAGGGPQIDFLAVVADGGIDDAEVDKIVGGQAALLAQLALGGLKRVLVRLELAGGQLPDLLAEGLAELT